MSCVAIGYSGYLEKKKNAPLLKLSPLDDLTLRQLNISFPLVKNENNTPNISFHLSKRINHFHFPSITMRSIYSSIPEACCK